MHIPFLCMLCRGRVQSLPEYVVYCTVRGVQLAVDDVLVFMQPSLDRRKGQFDWIEVGRVRREEQQARAAYLDHLTDAGDFVNQSIVDDEYRVWEGPLV